MIFRCVFGVVALGLDQIDLDLNRGIGQATQDLRFCDDFKWHQVEQRNAQRPDILRCGTVLGHDENVFTFQHGSRRQTVGYFDGQADPSFYNKIASFQYYIITDETLNHKCLAIAKKIEKGG